MLGALRDLIVGYSKSSSASIKCRREIFGRANFHPRVASLCINVSSKVGDDGQRTGEGTDQCCPTEKTPSHYSLDFSTSNSFVYSDVLNLGILLLDNFTKRKNKVGSQVLNMEKPVDGSKQGQIELDETHNQNIHVSNMAVYSQANLL